MTTFLSEKSVSWQEMSRTAERAKGTKVCALNYWEIDEKERKRIER
jgi:hypothetical protein